jgi:hypothetical protein
MYALVLILLCLPAVFAQQQTPSNHKKDAPRNDPTQSITVIVNPTPSERSPADKKDQSQNKPHGWPPWWESFWPYWAEVVVTGFAGFAAVLTLCAIRKQGQTMQRQLLEMKRTRIHTVREMKAAGTQTQDMLAKMESQVSHLENLAKATSKNADALINSERAWINARMVHESLDNYRLEIANYGRTMGHILHISFGTNCIEPNTSPAEPYGNSTNLPINTLILPNTTWQQLTECDKVTKRIADHFDPDWRDVQTGNKQGIFFFYVIYKDMRGEEHKSRFVYGYRIPNGRFEEFKEVREYT